MSARNLGWEAGRVGAGIDSNPFDVDLTPMLHLYWREGYLRGQREREIEEAEADGDIFRSR